MRGTGLLLVLCAGGLVGTPHAARADGAPGDTSSLSRVTLLADVGYSFPVGGAETGTDTRDVSFGLVPLSLIAGYELPRGFRATAQFRYALSIPTLCASAPDCEASLGHDVAGAVGIARALPRWRRLAASLGLELGWEWFTTELSDAGVAAFRSWNGPSARLEVFADLGGGGPWSLGPAVGVDVGMFTHFDLDTPAEQAGGSTDRAVHAWPTISFRIGRRL